ncbi:MAG: hypothetical protein JO257_11340 [Deltaproteobacteria bacterium]|nr:hypothetical protein [Deltaproteobacteria bacterium]
MPTNVDADIEVQRFGYAEKRLSFPRAQTHAIEGRTGSVAYGAKDCAFEGLEGRLDTLRWKAEAASIGSAYLKDDGGRFDVAINRAEFPHGIMLVRAEQGIELVSPHVTFSEVRIGAKGPFGRAKTATAAPAQPVARPATLRQQRLRFLDSLAGKINLTIKVQLDLPVVGHRTLDQQLRVPIADGSLDYRKLEESLDWLEGAFLDIKHDGNRLWVQWKVPIVGSSHELISWTLDREAATLATFGRVPVRSLADFRFAGGGGGGSKKNGGVLQAFTLDAIDVALSLLAPRHVEIGSGVVLFGGDDQPGMVDLKVTGAIRDRGIGVVRGAIGSVDTTIKDLRLGPVMLTADRLHFDGLDQLEVTFDGFTPTAVSVVVHRVTASNLALTIGSSPPASPIDQSLPR